MTITISAPLDDGAHSDGTDEKLWRAWLDDAELPRLDPAAWRGRRIVILAAHPDDEILGLAGLMQRLAQQGNQIVIAWATNGEASHPSSTAQAQTHLATLRSAESVEALRRLRVRPTSTYRWSLPDSGLIEQTERLLAEIRRVLVPGDVVMAPWRGDGHPDHEAVGAAAAIAVEEFADTIDLYEFPIWTWHWTMPADDVLPSSRLIGFDLSAGERETKRFAIDAFDTQVRPIGDGLADAAIVPPAVVAHFTRRVETLIR